MSEALSSRDSRAVGACCMSDDDDKAWRRVEEEEEEEGEDETTTERENGRGDGTKAEGMPRWAEWTAPR